MPDVRHLLAMGFCMTLPLQTLQAAETWKDPTTPTGKVTMTQNKKGAPPFTLSLLLVSKERKWAIINGGLVQSGDRIDGAMVQSITPKKVRLIHNKRILDLPAPIQVADPKKHVGHRNAS
ncbi:MAG: hypothetical protein HQL63_09790 [Magnetococcales bacterium]|nr:hypothetical protein [Magnetococcales bacterium]MBF0321507.1 hypothetical protein [Magnetococcales bacterium]